MIIEITNKIEAKFWAFHEENPHVYVLFDRFAREAAVRHPRIAVSLVIERIRWETVVVTRGDDFKINNNFRAYYARLWMREHPEFGELFETRRLLAGAVSELLQPATYTVD